MTRYQAMTKLRLAASGCVLAASLVSFPLAALAQDADGASADGEEILVTAQRRTERIQDVPASVTAIGGDTLTTRQITAVAEAIKAVPNVQVDMPYGYGGPPNFTIRGITAADAGLNLSKPIALYVDDSIRNSPLFEIQPMFDIDRLEVLRGPQGTLYGRNATGGTVKIVTKAPEFDNTGYVTLGYGNFNTKHAEGAANVELVDDQMALRVAAFYMKNDGWSKNLYPGVPNGDSLDQFALRAALRFRPTDNFDFVLRFNHMNSGGNELLAHTRYLAPHDLFYPPSIAAIPGVDNAGIGFWENRADFAGKRKIKSDGVNVQITWKPSDQYAISSVTSYDWGSFHSSYDVDSLPINWSNSYYNLDRMEQFYQELRIASSYSGPFNWQAGVNYVDERLRKFDISYDGHLDARCTECYDFFDPLFAYYFPYFGSFGFGQKRSGVSGFFRADFEVIPDLKIFGGVRYSKDKVRGINYYATFGDPFFGTFPLFQGVNIKDKFHNTSFEGGLDYKVAQDVLLYASFKEGYRAGQLSGAASFDASQVEIIPPETVKAYEVGLKSQFLDRKVTLNISASQTDYKHQQIVTLVQPPGLAFPLGILTSVPAARIRALEVEASVRPFDGGLFYANFGIADPKYTNGLLISGEDITGKQMIASTKFNANLGTSIDVIKLDNGAVTIGADATYLSKRYFDKGNNQSSAQKGYWVANASLGVEMGRLSINASVKNLFREKYSLVSYESIPGLIIDTRGAPRQFMVDATFRY